jgi:hypothetical protein
MGGLDVKKSRFLPAFKRWRDGRIDGILQQADMLFTASETTFFQN